MSTFLDCYVMALWIHQDNSFEYKFTDLSFENGKINLSVDVFTPMACALQPSLYFIAVPKRTIPNTFDMNVQYEIVFYHEK